MSSDGRPVGRPSRGTPKAERAESIDAKADQSSTVDWLEMAADRSAHRQPAVGSGRRKSLDTTQDDDWLGTRTTQKTADSAADYLGLGTEIDLTNKPLRFWFSLINYSLLMIGLVQEHKSVLELRKLLSVELTTPA